MFEQQTDQCEDLCYHTINKANNVQFPVGSMIRRAVEGDLPEILNIQRLAFKDEAAFVGDLNIKPMSQTLDELIKEFELMLILAYVQNGKILGSVRGKEEGGTCFISRLVVHPSHWGRGIGRSLMHEIERSFGDAKRYELYTREDNTRTRPFYRGLGYLPFKTEKVSDSLTFVHLEKINPVHP
jgi:ribosomal protein S18 acetylase RimI-like enzyme